MKGAWEDEQAVALLEPSKLELQTEDSQSPSSLQCPRWLRPVLRYRFGWLMVALLPACTSILVIAVLLHLQNIGQVRSVIPQRDIGKAEHLRLALASTNEAFPQDQVARLGKGLYVPQVDPANVCIVQADTRPVSRVHRPDYSAFNLTAMANMSYWDATVRHNLLYAIRHGYRYMHFDLEPIEGLYRTWSKVPAIRKAVDECEWTVFLDSDAYINKPQYSLHELLRHWGFHQKATFLQAMDPEDSPKDNFNTTNTGFWIIRSNELAKASLDRLARCPFDTPGCDEWAMKWANEQMAWTKYIRPDLIEGIDFIIASCFEANGYWYTTEYSGTGHVERCKGSLVTHGWQAKPNLAGRLERILSGEMSTWLQTILDTSSTSSPNRLSVP